MKAKTNRVFRVLRGSAFWFEFDDLRLTRHRGPPKSRNGYCGLRFVIRRKT